MPRKITTYAFIDASNLFYGGEKSLGWKIDYQKLLAYLKKRYGVERAYYFGGIDKRDAKKAAFYSKLRKFGYKLYLRPVKTYKQSDGTIKRKANCDVDMTLHLAKRRKSFDNVLVLSGDGDFLPVLKYLRESGKKVIIMARGHRTAKEIKRFAKGDFRDFEYLRELIRKQ